MRSNAEAAAMRAVNGEDDLILDPCAGRHGPVALISYCGSSGLA